MDITKKFNGETVNIFSQSINNNLVICPTNEYFKTSEAVCQAISFLRHKKRCATFELYVELFTDPILVTDGHINELDYEFVKFYCETETHIKIVWVEADNTGVLQIMMTTV